MSVTKVNKAASALPSSPGAADLLCNIAVSHKFDGIREFRRSDLITSPDLHGQMSGFAQKMVRKFDPQINKGADTVHSEDPASFAAATRAGSGSPRSGVRCDSSF